MPCLTGAIASFETVFMELLDKIQEKYLTEFTNTTPFDEFLLNVLVTALLVSLLRAYYVRFGTAIANRRRFADNFLPLALGTLLIIMVVKSSIALSLGLVGALSIVRFRAAIKDPEELTFLFIAIGLGLAGGANQPILAVVSFVLILGLLFLRSIWNQNRGYRKQQRLYINIRTEREDLQEITQILAGIFSFVELKRMDTLEKGMELSFTCHAETPAQLQTLKQTLHQHSPKDQLSIIDQPDLLL